MGIIFLNFLFIKFSLGLKAFFILRKLIANIANSIVILLLRF